MIKINVLTLFPDIFEAHLNHLPVKRALDKKLVSVEFVQIREFATDKRGTVDSPVYGGGPGMVLRPEPIFNAIHNIKANLNNTQTQIVFLTPKGRTYNQALVEDYAQLKQIIIVCGRYEGIDQRVIDHFKEKHHAQEISIGNYVLSGGEVPAMVIIESVVRLIPGAIENTQALTNESFNNNKTEHPQYGKPREWMGLKIPDTLLSGHHKQISNWKDENSTTLVR